MTGSVRVTERPQSRHGQVGQLGRDAELVGRVSVKLLGDVDAAEVEDLLGASRVRIRRPLESQLRSKLRLRTLQIEMTSSLCT